jgi:hypothetical protein
VIQARKYPPSHDESHHSVDVARNQPHAEQVEVLSTHKLERVDIYGIRISTRRRFLFVVMLVNEVVNASVVQEAVKQSVDEVVDDIKSDKTPSRVPNCHGINTPRHCVQEPTGSNAMINEHLQYILIKGGSI